MDQFDALVAHRVGLVKRSKVFNRILKAFNLNNKKVLDLGCGCGQYLVQFGPGSAGVTTTETEVAYGKKHGINIVKGNVEFIDELGLHGFEAVWANNLFEHLLSPHAFLMKLKTVSQKDTVLVLGVPVIPKIVSLLRVRKFSGALASPHINFFTTETLRYTVTYAGWQIKTIRPFFFQNELLDRLFGLIAPHQYVVAYNDTEFVYPDKKFNEWRDDEHYENLLMLGGRS